MTEKNALRIKPIMDLVKQYGEVYSLKYGCMHCDRGLRRKEAVSEATKEQLDSECEEMLDSIGNGIDVMVTQAEVRGVEEGYQIAINPFDQRPS
jgi:hypothetical protein